MLTAVPCILSIRTSLHNFSKRLRPFYSTKSNFSEVSLVHCNLWGVIQQRVYQPQLYNVNELKCAYCAAQFQD